MRNALSIPCLLALHDCKAATNAIVARYLDARKGSITDALRELEETGYARCLGYSQTPPSHPLHGRWWVPTRKSPAVLFDSIGLDPRFRSQIRLIRDEDNLTTHSIRFADGIQLRVHELLIARIHSEIIEYTRANEIDCIILSETELRSVRGWEWRRIKHARSLHWVPDLRIEIPEAKGGKRVVHVEVECSRKSFKHYDEALRCTASYTEVVYIADSARLCSSIHAQLCAREHRLGRVCVCVQATMMRGIFGATSPR